MTRAVATKVRPAAASAPPSAMKDDANALVTGEDRGQYPTGWTAVRARGARVLLRERSSGRERVFYDLISGYGCHNFGHRHPALVRALLRAVGRLDHMAVFPAEAALRLARRLLAAAGFADGRCYFTVGGSQAVEIALRIARLAAGRPGVAVMTDGFHGYGAETVQLSRDFLPPGLLEHLPRETGVTRLEWNQARAIDRLERAAESTGVLLLEPILGAAGFRQPDPVWFNALLVRARSLGIRVLVDEIQVGMGRTGKLLATEHLLPDAGRRQELIDGFLLSKSLGGGLYPLSAIVLNGERLADLDGIDERAALGETFTNSAMGCAVGMAVLDLLEAKGGRLMQEAARKGAFLLERLKQGSGGGRGDSGGPHDARGIGMALVLDFAGKPEALEFVRRAWEAGILCYVCGGAHHASVKLIPPLTLSWTETHDLGERLAGLLKS